MEVFNIIAGVSSIISLGISIISLVKVNGIQKSMKAYTKQKMKNVSADSGSTIMQVGQKNDTRNLK